MAVFGLSYYIYFSIEESEKVPEPETIFQSVELGKETFFKFPSGTEKV